MVDALMPFLSYFKAIVLRINWDSEVAITRISQPILFIAGLQDELVPHSHMRRLRSLAVSSKRAVWYPVPNGTHNDSWLRGGEKYFSELRKFLSQLDARAGDTSTCAADGADLPQAHEGSIPTMLQQPFMGSISKTQKPHAE